MKAIIIAFVMACTTTVPLLAAARHSRPLLPATAGWNRIVPDAAILGAARPLRYQPGTQPEYAGGMDDLRLFDASGREIPYVLIAPRSRMDRWIDGTLSPGSPLKGATSVELDLGAVRAVDSVEVSGVAAPWLKRIRLDGSGDRTRWNVLAAEATLFDLPEKGIANRKVAFAPGEFRYLRLVWDDRGTARVPAGYRLGARLHDEGAPTPTTPVPVQFSRRVSERRVSRYRLLLPAPHLPVTAIELTVANRDVDRSATVTETRLEGGSLDPVTLGSSRLLKTESGGATAASLTIPVSFPQGGELELSVDDGDNPPLAVLSVRAALAPLPTVCFEAAGSEPLIARYGDDTLTAPHYDLEAARTSLAQRLSSIPEARWGAGGEGASFVAEEIPTPGGGLLDTSGFFRTRAVPITQPGLTSLRLDPQLLGESPSLSDVRIVDSRKRQVPYLVERLNSDVTIALPISRRAERSRSVYQLSVPLDKLPPGSRLRLTTSARIFERDVVLERSAEPDRNRAEEILGQSVWKGADPEHAQEISLPIPGDDPLRLEIAIDEGDNAPLPITTVELLVKAAALRFVHPGGPLTLLYGKPGLAAPRYDIELLAARLLEAPAREISLQAPARPVAPVASSSSLPFFWAAVAAVALVLLLLLSRLLRHDVHTG